MVGTVATFDYLAANAAAIKVLSEENALLKATSKKKLALQKQVDLPSFIDGNKPVFIYSGQMRNSAELQKEALFAAMEGQEGRSYGLIPKRTPQARSPSLRRPRPSS
jgi:hypothetical protein